MESLLIEKPDNPIGFIVELLRKKYPDQVPIDGPPIEAAVAGSGGGGRRAEEEEEEEEEGEEDYVDEIRLNPKYQQKGREAHRQSVMSESPQQMGHTNITKVDKPPHVKESILNTLNGCVLFKHLEPAQLDTLADCMEQKKFDAGQTIIQQGDSGDFFYVVDSGSIDCFKDDKKVCDYHDGGAFGELAIMYNAPRAATCVAATKAVVWALERKAFKTILMKSTMQKREQYKDFLEQVDILREMSEYEFFTLADALVEETFQDGHVICRQDERGDTFYLIKEGTAVCSQKDAKGDQQEVARLVGGQYFGEIALMTTKPRQATVMAAGTLTVLSLDRMTFKRVMGPIEDILSRNMSSYTKIKAREI